ncbi:ATP-binding cassette domain-containing protein [Sciscionella sediminilitoris]|uniref:ATP-binding cassette domain-containing protein n=1 Tax=Sciscionella sediminilitoris TaxID=1445613 RepID=UPI001E307266|nr:ATP-binding cassette domain-containing protein [Sciscionella sp. SE31]
MDGVSFDLRSGETLGIVGESGSGKSTTGKTLLRLTKPTGGSARYRGRAVFGSDTRELRDFRRRAQMVFQDPYSSLNPRKRLGDILTEPLVIHQIGAPDQRQDRVVEMMRKLGLRTGFFYRYPHELSGGQRQRI